MTKGEQLDLYFNPELNKDSELNKEPELNKNSELNKDPLEVLVLERAKNWKERGKQIDLIFFLSACSRYHPALADLPAPMRAEKEIPMLKKIMEVLDEAKIGFTRAQVNNKIKELSEIAPKEIKSGWEDRKDLY